MTKSAVDVAALLALVIVGCGGSAIPVTKVADSESTLRVAEEAGASQIPEASLHLKLARDSLTQAQDLIKRGKNDQASLLLNQAQADAELALALAHEESERNAAGAAQLRLQQLQQPPVR